jgi:hypothetical protein
VLGVSRNFLLISVLVGAVLGFIRVICSGTLSDYVHGKNMFMIGCVVMGIFGFVYFALLDTKVT